MKIIQIEPYENGSRPALQTWDAEHPPEGYVFCPDEFAEVFYSTYPAGFVTIEHDGESVTAMEVNEEALAAYKASLPEPEEPEETATTDEVLNALLGVTA